METEQLDVSRAAVFEDFGLTTFETEEYRKHFGNPPETYLQPSEIPADVNTHDEQRRIRQ